MPVSLTVCTVGTTRPGTVLLAGPNVRTYLKSTKMKKRAKIANVSPRKVVMRVFFRPRRPNSESLHACRNFSALGRANAHTKSSKLVQESVEHPKGRLVDIYLHKSELQIVTRTCHRGHVTGASTQGLGCCFCRSCGIHHDTSSFNSAHANHAAPPQIPKSTIFRTLTSRAWLPSEHTVS